MTHDSLYLGIDSALYQTEETGSARVTSRKERKGQMAKGKKFSNKEQLLHTKVIIPTEAWSERAASKLFASPLRALCPPTFSVALPPQGLQFSQIESDFLIRVVKSSSLL